MLSAQETNGGLWGAGLETGGLPWGDPRMLPGRRDWLGWRRKGMAMGGGTAKQRLGGREVLADAVTAWWRFLLGSP